MINTKHHNFIGLSLANTATVDSGIAVLNREGKITLLDKLYTMDDIRFFFSEYAGIKNSIIMVSLPENPTMLNAKWKLYSRQYHLINSSKFAINTDDWMNRYSTRGCEYFKELNSKGIDIYRFDLGELKKSLGVSGMFKSHTPTDCKFLQDTLKTKLNLKELPANMLPAAQLEAILAAYSAKVISEGTINKDYKINFTYHDSQVLGLIENKKVSLV